MRPKTPVVLLFAAWIAVAATALGQPSGAVVEVSPTSLAFGSVCVGKSASKTVTIKNDDPVGENGQDLTVTDVERTASSSTSFAFTDPTGSGPVVLEPQETVGFTVTFNASLPPDNRTATFRVRSDGEPDLVSIPASATVVHRQIKVDASTVAFGEQRVGTRSPTKTLTIQNPGGDAINVTSIKRLGANGVDFVVTAPAVPFSIGAGDIRTVNIAFQPTDDGLRKGTLEITSNSCTQPKLNVSLVGTGVFPNVVVQPNPIDVGASPVGKASKPTAITVSNEGAAALKVSAIQIIGADAADFVLSGLPPVPKTLQPAESFVFSIRMTPTAEGLRLASINVLSDDPDGATFTVSVRGTGTPAVSPSPTASPTPTVSASATASSSASDEPLPAGTPNDSLAIFLVVGGVLSAFVGLIVVRRFLRTPEEDEDL
ncbi:MAG TPA: choice-of-anchor D domain-containing protein [Actinomycetota bacterium]|nr:choice-of-anchor D domain-containing protein [Actinomycetota bacterium]